MHQVKTLILENPLYFIVRIRGECILKIGRLLNIPNIMDLGKYLSFKEVIRFVVMFVD